MKFLTLRLPVFSLLLVCVLASAGHCINATPPGTPSEGLQFGLRFTGEIAGLDYGKSADSVKTDSDYGFGFGFLFSMPFQYFDLVPQFMLSARWTSIVKPDKGYDGLGWVDGDPVTRQQHWELIAEATLFVRLPLNQFVRWLPLYVEFGPRGSLVPWSEILRNGEKPFKGEHYTDRIPVEVGFVGGIGISLWKNHINLDAHYSHAITDFCIREGSVYRNSSAYQWELGLSFLF
jgi:hypothetical protein